MSKSRNRPTELGKQAGFHLARFCDQQEMKITLLRPRCASCAFRAGTIPNGCESTVMDALKCSMEGLPFMCHEDKAQSTKCAGWLLMRSKKPLKVVWPFSDEPA